MDVELLIAIVGILGNAFSTILKLFIGLSFWTVIVEVSTEGVQPLPRCIALLNDIIGVYYSYTAHVKVLVVANGISTSMEVIYLCTYLIHATRELKMYTFKLFAFFTTIVGLPMILSLSIENVNTRLNFLGWMYVITNVSDCLVSNLGPMWKVIQTKNSKNLPIIPSILLMICAAVWCFYAYLISNPFVAIPNSILFVFGIGRVVLHIKYKVQNEAVTIEMEG